MTASSSDHDLHLIIRFAVSIPDLPLSLPLVASPTVLALKLQIRAYLPPEYASNALRIIYAGKILQNTQNLATVLKLLLPSPPPVSTVSERANGTETQGQLSSKAQGKRRVYAAPTEDITPSHTPPLQQKPPIYLHCSIGNKLSPRELAAEDLSYAYDDALPPTSPTAATFSTLQRPSHTIITPTPIGFDRLLSAGFTAADISALRTQFLALQSARHTPETMPTVQQLRQLEDRWLDSSSASDTPNTAGGEGIVEEDGPGAGLDDMLLGAVLGFFWPMGALVWGLREEGVWSARRQVAVLAGVVVNFGFGFLWVIN